jgi:STE24 endopeptidase
MNGFLVLILFFYLGAYLLNSIADLLNVKNIKTNIPSEFEDIYDKEAYEKSQRYLKENTIFSFIHETLMVLLTVIFIVAGGFNYFDLYVRSFGFGPYISGLCFIGLLIVVTQIIEMPFSLYSTFIIEKKYGFNKTTIKTFIMDRIKSWILGTIIGSLILLGILWIFTALQSTAWLIAWLFLSVVQLFIYFIGPIWIMPLFNKFKLLENSELHEKITKYFTKQEFKVKNIYEMDGSKRSTKSNAFFTGFGNFRRIVLFDTLIAKHTISELISIVAHELGHYKNKHIYKLISISIIFLGIMFYLLSRYINHPILFQAFKMENISLYASLVFFSFIYVPFALIQSLVFNICSRGFEYQADEFAYQSTKDKKSMILALKKLSKDNLSNLTPHGLKVFLQYSHPPVLARIRRLKYYK